MKVFVQTHYLENFVQASFNALTEEKVRGPCPYKSKSLYVFVFEMFPFCVSIILQCGF